MADGCVNGIIGGGRKAFIGAVASRNRPEVVIAGGCRNQEICDSAFSPILWDS
jgi:hypothetical protein